MELSYYRNSSLKEVQLVHVKQVMAAQGGNKTRAQKILGIARSTLYRYLDEIKKLEKSGVVL